MGKSNKTENPKGAGYTFSIRMNRKETCYTERDRKTCLSGPWHLVEETEIEIEVEIEIEIEIISKDV